jgi:hypothetical protein
MSVIEKKGLFQTAEILENYGMVKFLSDTQYVFTLEPYTDGTPAPTVVTKEVDMTVSAPFLLTKPDFSKTEVKAYVVTIVAPAMDYWNSLSV